MEEKLGVTSARFAAETRNHYWRVERGRSGADAEVIEPLGASYYPAKGANYNDRAAKDAGKNFGRVSRGGGIMDEYIDNLMREPVSGIPLGAWQRFVLIFSEGQTTEGIRTRLEQLRATFPPDGTGREPNVVERVLRVLEESI